MELKEIEYEINRFKQSTKPLIVNLNDGRFSQVKDKKSIVKIEGDYLIINFKKIKLEDIKQVYVKDI
jgi:hypothetical protein